MIYRFIRTVVHTEMVEVEGDNFEEALERAGDTPNGVHQGDDSMVCIELEAPSHAKVVGVDARNRIEADLLRLGFRMEPSLSSLDGNGDALIDASTGELVDPPSSEVLALAIAWSEFSSPHLAHD